MKKFIAYSMPLMIFIVSGCIARTIPYDVERQDQELTGNRGVIMGKAAKGLPETEEKKTKRLYRVEIELGSPYDQEISGTAEGNKGYVQGKKSRESSADRGRMPTPEKGVARLQPLSGAAVPQVVYQRTSQTGMDKYKKEAGSGVVAGGQIEQRTYTVEKGDTLQKISQKMYGTTKRWKKIYEANKGVIKNPDKIKPGQKLVIPAE